MPIYQINVWVCELCETVQTTSEIVSPYSDPVVTYPSGGTWEYIAKDDREVLVCPTCQTLSIGSPIVAS